MEAMSLESLEQGSDSSSDSGRPTELSQAEGRRSWAIKAGVAGILLGALLLTARKASSPVPPQVGSLDGVEQLVQQQYADYPGYAQQSAAAVAQTPAVAAQSIAYANAGYDQEEATTTLSPEEFARKKELNEPWRKLVCLEAADAHMDVKETVEKLPEKQWFPNEGAQCMSRFQLPAAAQKATDYNGMALPDTCFQTAAPGGHHVFLIGDWGGLAEVPWNTSMTVPSPADHRSMKHFPAHHRTYVWDVDDKAQVRVADAMRKRAAVHAPDYILNVGDNFYWGGINVKCGAPMDQTDRTHQWSTVYERIYTGPGIDGKQWLGVLGNHDYGGFLFVAGWDQQILYSWLQGGISTGRWVTPALYYSAKVIYPDFAVDYYFTDSNVWDSWVPTGEPHHNVCSEAHNPPAPQDNCGESGPVSAEDCTQWFKNLWAANKAWLRNSVPKSQAEWQIVVTHFPPEAVWGGGEWAELVPALGIDLILAGHRHTQEIHKNGIGGATYVVSGGGGGITSENEPRADGQDDAYGFVDLTLTKSEIRIQMISHSGAVRSTTCVGPGGAVLPGAALCANHPAGPVPLPTPAATPAAAPANPAATWSAPAPAPVPPPPPPPAYAAPVPGYPAPAPAPYYPAPAPAVPAYAPQPAYGSAAYPYPYPAPQPAAPATAVQNVAANIQAGLSSLPSLPGLR